MEFKGKFTIEIQLKESKTVIYDVDGDRVSVLDLQKCAYDLLPVSSSSTISFKIVGGWKIDDDRDFLDVLFIADGQEILKIIVEEDVILPLCIIRNCDVDGTVSERHENVGGSVRSENEDVGMSENHIIDTVIGDGEGYGSDGPEEAVRATFDNAMDGGEGYGSGRPEEVVQAIFDNAMDGGEGYGSGRPEEVVRATFDSGGQEESLRVSEDTDSEDDDFVEGEEDANESDNWSDISSGIKSLLEEDDLGVMPKKRKRTDVDGVPFKVTDGKDIVFEVGPIFDGKKEFKDALKDYSIKGGYKIKTIKNDLKRVTTVCGIGCPWRIHASKVAGQLTFMVKTLSNDHKCLRISNNKAADSKWISTQLGDLLKANPNLDNATMTTCLNKWGVEPQI